MEKKGYNRISDFIDIIRLPEIDTIDEPFQPVAVVNDELCNGCKKCVDPCTNGAVIFLDKTARVLPGRCEGCGSCSYICPQGAISLEDFDAVRNN